MLANKIIFLNESVFKRRYNHILIVTAIVNHISKANLICSYPKDEVEDHKQIFYHRVTTPKPHLEVNRPADLVTCASKSHNFRINHC